MNLSSEQLDFLNNEFKITESDIEKITKDEWFSIREKSFMIEAEEVPDSDDEEISERGRIATSIADVTYKKLKEI